MKILGINFGKTKTSQTSQLKKSKAYLEEEFEKTSMEFKANVPKSLEDYIDRYLSLKQQIVELQNEKIFINGDTIENMTTKLAVLNNRLKPISNDRNYVYLMIEKQIPIDLCEENKTIRVGKYLIKAHGYYDDFGYLKMWDIIGDKDSEIVR